MAGKMEVAKHEADEEAYALSYQSRPPLAKPGTYLRDIDWLIKAMNDNKIEINPEYQREVVWTADRMSQLIDSLMENYYIPPLIFNRQTDKETGETMLVCVDGKQRLSSVQAFVRGIIPCSDNRGDKWWFQNAHVGTKKKNLLSTTAQEDFLNKDFVTFEYVGLEPHQEEDLFARVQMGMPLSVAEKMRATSGPWQELARHFIGDFPVIYSLQKDRARAKDFQLTLSCFSQIVEVQHPTPSDGVPTHKSKHTHLSKLVERDSFLDDDLRSHLASVWKTLKDLIELDPNTFTNADKRLKGVQTFAPVEMMAVTVLISVHLGTPNKRLLECIRSMREYLRENSINLFNNSSMWKIIWAFIDSLDKRQPADNNDAAGQNAPSITQALPSRPAPSPAKTGPKKGRPTARTKPATVLPGTRVDSTALKSEPTEPEPELDVAEPRSRKRQRADTTSSTTKPALANAKRPMPVTNMQAMAAWSAPPTKGHTLPPFASLGAPIPAPENSISSQDSFPTPNSTPPLMPAETRQNQRSQRGAYYAPIAPMGLEGNISALRAPGQVLPTTPLHSPVTRPIKDPPVIRQAPALVWKKPILPPNRQVFAPQSPVTGPEGFATINSGRFRPTIGTQNAPSKASQATANTARPSTEQKKKQKRKSIPQYDGVIDLTDDMDMTDDESETVEKKRANLLSAFQGGTQRSERHF